MLANYILETILTAFILNSNLVTFRNDQICPGGYRVLPCSASHQGQEPKYTTNKEQTITVLGLYSR